MSSHREGNKIATHVSGFDDLTGGGMPKASAVIFYGKEDYLKGMLVKQICWNILQEGGKVLYCAVDRPVKDIRNDMGSNGWCIEPFEKTGRFRFADVYSDIARTMTSLSGREPDVAESTPVSGGVYARTILNTIYSVGIRFLPIVSLSKDHIIAVVDSLSPLFSSGDKDTSLLLNALKDATRLNKSSGIGVINGGINETIVENTIGRYADGLVKITSTDNPMSPRSIEIVKYPGQYELGRFPLEVGQGGIGIMVATSHPVESSSD